jgi:hypothetical protein
MRQFQASQHRLMALEEFRIALQITGDRLLFGVHRGKSTSLSSCHNGLNLDVTFKGYLCRAGEPDIFTRAIPVYL